MFIVFGIMCVLAAIQFYFTYPETGGKTLEEIEILFSPDGPRPWQTKFGDSRLDGLVAEARNKRYSVDDVNAGRVGSITDIQGDGNKNVGAAQNIEKV